MNKLERILLGIVILEIPIQVDAYLFFREQWAEYGAIGGVNVSITTICLGLLYACWLIKYAVASGYPWRERLFIGYSATAYACCVGLSLWAAHDRVLALNSLALIVQAYLIYTYVANRVSTRHDAVFVVAMLLLALAAQGAIMIGIYAAGQSVSVGPVTGMITEEYRVGGTIGSPVVGASYLALLLALAVAVFATDLALLYKLLAIASLLFGSVALMLTLTRGAWLAAALSITVLLAVSMYRRLITVWIPATCAVAVVVLGLLFQQSIVDRLLGDDEGSAQSRIPLIHVAWDMIEDYPLTGVGTNNAAAVGSQYIASPEFRSEWFYTIHNKYFLEWVELGTIGLLAFLWFLGTTLWRGWETWQRRDTLLSPIAAGLALAIFGQMLHMSVDVFNSRPQVQSLWLCAGLIVALSRMETQE